LDAELGEKDTRLLPFHKALHSCIGVVTVFEDAAKLKLATPYTRMWCIYEAWVATSTGKSCDLLMSTGAIATTKPFHDGGWEFGSFDSAAAGHVLDFSAERGQTSAQSDRVRLLNLMTRQSLDATPPVKHPVYDRLNTRMHERVAGPILRTAAREGDVERLRQVMDHCPKLLLSSTALRGSLGETAVHTAAAAGQLRALRLLLEHRASANDQDLAGETPLHYAALAGQAVAIWELFRSGADTELVSFAGETPLDVAWQNPAYFCGEKGVDTTGAAEALMAASEDGGELAHCEYDGRRADDRFMREHHGQSREVEETTQMKGCVDRFREEVAAAAEHAEL